MSYCFVPSLLNMAATQIMALLWNRGDVIALIAEYNVDEECDEDDIGNYSRDDDRENYSRDDDWRMIEDRVKEKVSVLLLPAVLEEKLSSLVVPIGDQIRRWKMSHAENFGFDHIPREFRWTSRGTLDKKGTAEAFVRDPSIPEGERYGMACLYCLEWDEPIPLFGAGSYHLYEFEAFWTFDRTGDATALYEAIRMYSSKTPYQRAFHCAVEWGNEVTAEHYLLKLSPAEREESLSDVELPRYSLPYFDMYRFLLLHMDEGQQSKLLEARGKEVLISLLEWPWQPLFVDVARHIQNVSEHFGDFFFFFDIVRKIEEGYEDYCYRELFGTIWVQIPVDRKKYLIRGFSLLWHLFPVIGEKNISLMLRDWSQEEKEQILFSKEGIWACSRLAQKDKLGSLDCFVGECLLSRDKMIHFKEECKRVGNFGSPFFEWIDGLIEKRGREEKDSPVPHKRLCVSPGVSTDHI